MRAVQGIGTAFRAQDLHIKSHVAVLGFKQLLIYTTRQEVLEDLPAEREGTDVAAQPTTDTLPSHILPYPILASLGLVRPCIACGGGVPEGMTTERGCFRLPLDLEEWELGGSRGD